ncbi:MAG TPA: helix-turn-helix domain-containing protein [Thermoguttaceae bacterium]|nr:helix-turn-helix domain-containing protein [Thermoguttaceae bacterium]
MTVRKQNDIFQPIEVEPVPRLALRLPEAAMACGLSESFLHNMANSGEIPSIKIGRVRLFPVERLRKWLLDASERPETVMATAV